MTVFYLAVATWLTAWGLTEATAQVRAPRRRYYKAGTPGMEHLQGVRATADGGTCSRCDGLILKDQRIVRQGEGWIHASCHSGQDDR